METRDFSPITWSFERCFRLLQFLPPQVVMQHVLASRSSLTSEQVNSPDFAANRARKVEYFVLAYLFLDVLAFASAFTTTNSVRLLFWTWACLRIIDIIQATVNVTLFDRLRNREADKVASTSRLVVLGFVNFAELLLCFAVLYADSIESLD